MGRYNCYCPYFRGGTLRLRKETFSITMDSKVTTLLTSMFASLEAKRRQKTG